MIYIFLLFIFVGLIYCKTREFFSTNINKCNNIVNKNKCNINNKCVWCKKTKLCTDLSLYDRTYCEPDINITPYKVTDKIYKAKLNGVIRILQKGCYDRCSKKECEKLYSYIQSAEDCLKCQKNKNNCYHKELVTGYCSPCEKNEKQNSCMLVNKFGCPNPNDLNNMNGIMPYYYEVKSNSVNSPYNTECKFCWNLK